jgi:hypothetical protein
MESRSSIIHSIMPLVVTGGGSIPPKVFCQKISRAEIKFFVQKWKMPKGVRNVVLIWNFF